MKRALHWLAIVAVVTTALSVIQNAPYDGPDARTASFAEAEQGPRKAVGVVPEIDLNMPHVPGELIVKLKPQVSLSAASQVAGLLGASAQSQLLMPDYWQLSFPQGQDLVAAASNIRQNPSVQSVELNGYSHLYFTPNDPSYSRQWNLPMVQAPQAWDVSKGDGVTVAVIDSGVAYENYGGYMLAPDLAGTTFVGGWNFLTGNSHANDDNGHGTHVAGTIAQSTNNGTGVAGIAYQARIMPIKVCGNDGNCTSSNISNGIRWAADNGAKVINLSLGGSASTAIEDAVKYAFGKGVVVVAAAGNEFGTPVSYPAAYENAIAVGAVRYDKTLAAYSNYGAALDLVAPGGDTMVDQNNDGYADGILQQTFCNPSRGQPCQNIDPTAFGYYYFQGTSMAAPHVSAIAALLIARGNATTPTAVKLTLQNTAEDLGSAGWDQTYGYGLVQAYDALQYSAPAYPFQASVGNVTKQPCNRSQQALTNGSFESGLSGWAVDMGSPAVTSAQRTDGSYSLLFGRGYNYAEDAVEQTVSVPGWAETSAVYFDWLMYSSDSTSVRYDYLALGVFDRNNTLVASGAIYNTAPRAAWYVSKLPILNITNYRGQPLTLVVLAETDSSYPTWWYADKVQLIFACGATLASEEDMAVTQAGHAGLSDLEELPLADQQALKAMIDKIKPTPSPKPN